MLLWKGAVRKSEIVARHAEAGASSGRLNGPGAPQERNRRRESHLMADRPGYGIGGLAVAQIERQLRQGLGIEYRRHGEPTHPQGDGLRLRDDFLSITTWLLSPAPGIGPAPAGGPPRSRRGPGIEPENGRGMGPASFRMLPEFGLGQDDRRRGLGTKSAQRLCVHLTHAQDPPDHDPQGTFIQRLERNDRRRSVFRGCPALHHPRTARNCRQAGPCLASLPLSLPV